MVYLDKSIEIRAPPERVFQFLTQVWRAPRWHPGLVRAISEDGKPLHEGSTFHAVEETAGLRLERESEAVEVAADRRVAWRLVDGDFARHEGAYELVPTAQGTRVRLKALIELPFILPRIVTHAELERALSVREDAALWKLKDTIEGRKGQFHPTGFLN